MKIVLAVATLITVFGFGICLFAIQNSGEPYFLALGVPYVIALFVMSVVWDKYLLSDLEV